MKFDLALHHAAERFDSLVHDAAGSQTSIYSDQMVLGTVRWEAGPRERQPKALRTKLAQRGPSGSSPLKSDGSRDGQVGG